MSRFIAAAALLLLAASLGAGRPDEKGQAGAADPLPKVRTGLAVEEMPNDAPHGGLIVRNVTPGGPADQAGLKKGDIIVRVSNRLVEDYDDLLGALAGHRPGEKVTFTLLRGRGTKDVKVALAKAAPDGEKAPKVEGCQSAPYLGVLIVPLDELSEDTADRLGLGDERGLVVLDVVPGSPAAKAGLRHGDLIRSMDGQALAEPDAMRRRVRTGKVGQEVKLQVQRGEQSREVKATLAQGPCDILLFIPKEAPGAGADASRVIERLQRRVDQLEQRLRQLEGKRRPKGKERGEDK